MKLLKTMPARLALFYFVLSICVLGQPGKTCVLDYNPFEVQELGYVYGNMGTTASYSWDVFKKRIDSRYIFIGKILSQESGKMYSIEAFPGVYFIRVKMKVIKVIAGRIGKTTVDLNIQTSCWQTIGQPEIGSDYIFFADEINTTSFKRLISLKWSAALDGIPKGELNKITKEILEYRNGVKRPLVVGYLIKHKPNPDWDYVNSSFNRGSVWRFPKFKNDWRIKKWQYDPEYAEPLKNVRVVVKNMEGAEIASTVTDVSGRFEFADLPKGDYVITPDVPKSYRIVGKCYLNDVKEGGVGFYVPDNKRVCDRTIRLDVEPTESYRMRSKN